MPLEAPIPSKSELVELLVRNWKGSPAEFSTLVELEGFSPGRLVNNNPLREIIGAFVEQFFGGEYDDTDRAKIATVIAQRLKGVSQLLTWANYWRMKAQLEPIERCKRPERSCTQSAAEPRIRTLVGENVNLENLFRCNAADARCSLRLPAIQLASELVRGKTALMETQDLLQRIRKIVDAAEDVMRHINPVTLGVERIKVAILDFEQLATSVRDIFFYVEKLVRTYPKNNVLTAKDRLREMLLHRAKGSHVPESEDAQTVVTTFCRALNALSTGCDAQISGMRAHPEGVYSVNPKFRNNLKAASSNNVERLISWLEAVKVQRVSKTHDALRQTFANVTCDTFTKQFEDANLELPHNKGTAPNVWPAERDSEPIVS